MSRETALEALKIAMNTVKKANLTMSMGRARYVLDDKELELIEQDAIAITDLANGILETARSALMAIDRGNHN